jgi:hypothetical protein
VGFSGKHGKLDQVVVRHGFEPMSSLAPCPQTADDDERLESLCLQEMRHPGASRFARSSTVEINFPVLGQVLNFFLEVVGFDADGSRNALRGRVVVAVAAHVGDQDGVVFV